MTNGRRAMRLAVVVLGLATFAADVPASVVVPMTLAELSRDARVIVEAEVVAVHVTADTGRVERVVSLRVLARWKGDSDHVVHLRLPGGTHGRTHTVVTGVPSMRVAERFVLDISSSRNPKLTATASGELSGDVTAGPVAVYLHGQASAAPEVRLRLSNLGDGWLNAADIQGYLAGDDPLPSGLLQVEGPLSLTASVDWPFGEDPTITSRWQRTDDQRGQAYRRFTGST